MSKLNIDQKSVKALFSEKKAGFLIPDYQRPYAWGEKECQTLWDDLFLFAFPDNDCDKLNSDSDEYFLAWFSPFSNIQNENRIGKHGWLLAQLHGSFTPAHADGCVAQCFVGVQRESIFNLPVRRRPQAAILVLRPGVCRSPVS